MRCAPRWFGVLVSIRRQVYARSQSQPPHDVALSEDKALDHVGAGDWGCWCVCVVVGPVRKSMRRCPASAADSRRD